MSYTFKNKFVFTLALSALCVGAFAQGETRFGIKAGITSAQLYGPDIHQLSNNGNPSSLSGFHFGMFVNSKIKKDFWIKSELLLIQKGGMLQTEGKSGVQFQSKFKSQYIDVYPISPTFHWKGFQVLAGPYISMLLSSSAQDSVGNANSNIFGSATTLSSYRQKLDAGVVIGAEYETKWGISIGLRYTRGYVPLFENPSLLVTNVGGPPQPQQKVYNETLNFSLGYSFGNSKKEKPKTK